MYKCLCTLGQTLRARDLERAGDLFYVKSMFGQSGRLDSGWFDSVWGRVLKKYRGQRRKEGKEADGGRTGYDHLTRRGMQGQPRAFSRRAAGVAERAKEERRRGVAEG